MNKIENNTSKRNQTILDSLMQTIINKSSFADELIEIHNLYGVFINNNSFRICKEVSTIGEYCKVFELHDFFSNSLIKWTVEYKEIDIDIPWRKIDEFYLYNDEKAIAIPLKVLLNKNSLKGITTKENIITLSKNINNILKENPEFIDIMFIQIESNKQI